ncbi:hypothetical protein R1sor_003804 [Riccia sorocarpa]|uniref:PPPDE domain-containing protein n=1 Tax=Riccia sorocarpa TaxID=122646 RepID=A0ABD3H5G5_9MARC
MRTSVPTTGSDGSGATSHVPVYLNVYDLTPMNGYVYWVGMGIFHSGIEVHGSEYAFGAHDFPTSGVFEVEPQCCPGFTFRRSILMGTTGLSPQEIRNFIETVADDYNGNTYHLLVKNCNHFTNDVCSRLLGKGIPGWVNRLAGVGVFCSCLLPESLKVPAPCPSDEDFEGPEQKLTRSLTSLSNSLVDNLSSKESAEGERNQDDELGCGSRGEMLFGRNRRGGVFTGRSRGALKRGLDISGVTTWIVLLSTLKWDCESEIF